MLIINGVTGSVGMELASLAHSYGLEFAGIGRNQKRLRELSSKYPGTQFFELVNISSEAEASSILKKVLLSHDSRVLNYVHAAATLTRSSSPLSTSVESFRATIETNLVGAFVWNKTVMLEMISNQLTGALVNISSQAARSGGYGGTTAYAAAKAGLVTLTKTFARTGAPHNIRANSISPGFIDNEMMTGGLEKEDIRMFIDRVPLGRLATNREIAEVILFLAGPGSTYMTGENIEISGGLSLG